MDPESDLDDGDIIHNISYLIIVPLTMIARFLKLLSALSKPKSIYLKNIQDNLIIREYITCLG